MNKCISSSRYIDVLGLCIVHIMIQAYPSIKLMENATLLYIFLVRIYLDLRKGIQMSTSGENTAQQMKNIQGTEDKMEQVWWQKETYET